MTLGAAPLCPRPWTKLMRYFYVTVCSSTPMEEEGVSYLMEVYGPLTVDSDSSAQ